MDDIRRPVIIFTRKEILSSFKVEELDNPITLESIIGALERNDEISRLIYECQS